MAHCQIASEPDALQVAQEHCRALQEEYRKLIAAGTAIKSDKFKCEKVCIPRQILQM
jgi:hypothetical protein